ncbi:shikimate kinase [Flavobacteriaceae bacterium]|jgi:shikimate kinase|nr:shikimate kinase [Flavobacteriaceae bacterium]
MKIILLGYMGSGKTTIGIQLARKLFLNFTDLDDFIEEKEQKSIKEIFKQKGEIYFRKIEHKYLKQFINENESYVLSLGGGTPCYAGNLDLILKDKKSLSFYLRGSIPTLFKRLSENKFKRPLISDLSDDQLTEYLAKHLFERSLFYDKATHKISIDNKEIQEIVTEIRILLH